MSRLALGMRIMVRRSSGWQTTAPRVTTPLGVPISNTTGNSRHSMRQYSATSFKGAQAPKSAAVKGARKTTSKEDKAEVAAADSAPAKKRKAKAPAAAAAKQTTKATTTRTSAVANSKRPEAVEATTSRPATTPAAPDTPPNQPKAHLPTRPTMPTLRPYIPTPPPRPSPASHNKEPKKPISTDSPEYKEAKWKWVSTIVALPIFLLTSYVLYDRLVVGFLINRDTTNTPAERLRRVREEIANREKGSA